MKSMMKTSALNTVRAERNRTLTVSENEIASLQALISSEADLHKGFRDNMIVNGDLSACLDDIPDAYFDLIIIDPPYNLDKDFHGNKFQSMDSTSYEVYLRSWF